MVPPVAQPSSSSRSVRFLTTLRRGDIVHGTVTRIESFGVFVDLDGGPEPELGFVPPTELSWKWISSAHEVVTLGQRVSAEVLALDTETRGQAVLSLCALRENPWMAWVGRIGSVVTGHVTGNFVPHGRLSGRGRTTVASSSAGALPQSGRDDRAGCYEDSDDQGWQGVRPVPQFPHRSVVQLARP